jgi:hypothetical protein
MTASSSSAPNEYQTDAFSRAAIRDEIGDRLRISLPAPFGRLPEEMLPLLERLADAQPRTSRMNRKTESAQ